VRALLRLLSSERGKDVQFLRRNKDGLKTHPLAPALPPIERSHKNGLNLYIVNAQVGRATHR